MVKAFHLPLNGLNHKAGDIMGKIIVKGITYGGGDCANQNLADEFSESSTYAVDDYVIYNQDLYQCTTAVSTAGPWDNTKWTKVQITDVIGGSSVSTLEDLTDVNITNPAANDTIKWNPTTQKWENGAGGGTGDVADVYVNGASVLDSNKIAQITNYVELTQAEYDALPASKESDNVLYCIKDKATADTTVAPIIYSEEEREVGVWTDGKPLYQKTYHFNITSSGETITVAQNLNYIDTLVSMKGIMGNATMLPQGSRGSCSEQIWGSLSNYSLTVFVGSGGDVKTGASHITLQYTKTTDTPGSGKYAPSGVPAVHYSENEQVVGTWIDGSTLYEKTLYKDLSGQAEHWYVYLDTLIDDINDYTIINFQGQLQFKEGSYIYAHVIPSPNATCYINRDSSRWYLYYHSGNATCDWGYITVTIRYVKEILGQPSS